MHLPLHISSSHHHSLSVALCSLSFSVFLLLAQCPFSHVLLPLCCLSFPFPHPVIFKRLRLHPSRPTPPPLSNVLFHQFQTDNNHLHLIHSLLLWKTHVSCVPDYPPSPFSLSYLYSSLLACFLCLLVNTLTTVKQLPTHHPLFAHSKHCIPRPSTVVNVTAI